MIPEEQKQNDVTQPDGVPSASPGPDTAAAREAGTARSPSRRRLLTRSLIGGPVALAAMRPVKTLASTYYCKYSGWHSFKLNTNSSAAPKNKSKKCKTGKKIGHYRNGSGWPSSITNHNGYSITLHAGGSTPTKFKDCFGGTDTTTLNSYLGGSSNQAAFITALFNAKLVSGYPFTVSKIYTIWSSPGTLGSGVTLSGAALFFNQLDVNA